LQHGDQLTLSDAVKEFEAARGVSSDTGRARRSAARRVNYKTTSEDEGSEEETEAAEPRKDSAMTAVMDFLDDQDSEYDSDD